MIDMKCPGCGAGGRVPRDKKNTRLVCKKCLKVFHLSPTGTPVLGEPPATKDAPKEKAKRESTGGGVEFGGSFDDLTQRFGKIKLPRISGAAAGISALAILIAALGIWFFARQSLKTRAEIVAKAVMNPESVKAAIDVAVPETAMDVIRWHSKASMQYGELKMAMAGSDAGMNINILSDSASPAVVVLQFSAAGTRLGNAGVEALHTTPSLANTSSKLDFHLYFVKDSFGNWLLDGTRTFNDAP